MLCAHNTAPLELLRELADQKNVHKSESERTAPARVRERQKRDGGQAEGAPEVGCATDTGALAHFLTAKLYFGLSFPDPVRPSLRTSEDSAEPWAPSTSADSV